MKGAVVNHIDGDNSNNNYKNLEWVTQKENIHKSYKSSGINQVRNYKIYYIIHPDGRKSGYLKGIKEVENYIINNNLPIKLSMIMKHKKHNNYIMNYKD